MASVRNHIRIRRSPDEVWKVVADAGAMAWFPAVLASSASGSTRLVEFDDGITLEEQIVTSDDELRRFQYRVARWRLTEGHQDEWNPDPSGTFATVDVIDDQAGALAIYSTEIDDEFAEMVTKRSADALQGLKQYLES